MGDVNTSALACRDCGTEIVRAKPRGRPPSLCERCRRSARNRSTRDDRRRRRAGIPPVNTFTCIDCGHDGPRPSPHGPPPDRCHPCWSKRELERGTRRREAILEPLRIKFRTQGRWTTCRGCGGRIRNARQKGPARYWCLICERRRGHKLRESRMAAVESEVFPRAEIFERDGWRCGICRKRINPKLSHPHPLSASLDHVVPVVEGGGHTRANCRASHLRCNLRRRHFGGGEQLALIG